MELDVLVNIKVVVPAVVGAFIEVSRLIDGKSAKSRIYFNKTMGFRIRRSECCDTNLATATS